GFHLYTCKAMTYDYNELIILTRAFMRATGMSGTKLGILSAGNNRFVDRILRGNDCQTRNAERLSDYLDAHWPAGVDWPDGVRPRKRRRKTAMAA
ncbi:MAG: hypothetical protein J2P48_08300, partial [Alphaproteobacteria bacterium]|nr:hypothetical protein [Alphaproteobacteria bacterium]